MKRIFFTVSTLCLFMLLTGCAAFRPAPPPANKSMSVDDRHSELSSIHSWDIKGSISVQHQNKTDIASWSWAQRGDHYAMNIHGPLSLGSTKIVGNSESVTLWKSNGQHFAARSPEALLQQQLGWSIPISDLYYWIRGLPAPDAPANTRYDRYNHLVYLEQEGWTVQYIEYTREGDVDLPKKIWLSNPRLNVRLAISQWKIY